MKTFTRTALLLAAVGIASFFVSPDVEINDPTSAANEIANSEKVNNPILDSEKVNNPILSSINF